MLGPKTRKILIVVALSILVITAVPATVANTDGQLVDGSSHTTGSDFNNGQLTNMVVEGGGESAEVALERSVSTIDSFEDQDLSEYTGDTGSFGTSTNRATDGSNSLYSDSNNQEIVSNNGLSDYPGPGDTFEVDVWLENGAGTWIIFGNQDANNRYRLGIHSGNNELILQRVDGGSQIEIDTVSYNPSYEQWLTVSVEWQADGTMTATVENGGTVEASVSGQDATFGAGGIGFDTSPQTDIYLHYWDNFRVDSAPNTAQYTSADHTVSNAQQATVDITQSSSSSADLIAEYHDGSSWVQGASTTTSSTGVHTLSLPSVSSSRWRVRVDVTTSSSDAQFALTEDSIQFTNDAPTVDDSSATPSGNVTVTSAAVDLSIDVDDPQFGTWQGESVTVTFHNADTDSVIGTDTLSSGGGTASVEWSSVPGGGGSWYAVAEDSYGGIQQSGTFTFTAPGELLVYDEQRFPELINETQINATVYVGDETYFRETSDGSINFGGLPTGDQMTIEVEADGYADRTVIIDSLFEQASIFMLSDSTDSVQIAFQVDDSTGSFSGNDVELLVQRPIVQNGETEWRTVIGNGIGANNKLPVTLEQDGSYRLVVRTDGESRILGKYKASQSVNPEILPIGSVDISTSAADGTAFGATLDTITDDDGNITDRLVRLTYIDSVDATDELTYRVVRTDTTNENVIVGNTTEFDPSRQFTTSIPIDISLPDNASYRVEYWTERSGEPDVSGDRLIGDVDEIADKWGLDGRVMRWLGYTFIVGFAGLTVVRSPRLASIGTVVITSLLTTIGVLSISPILLGMGGAVALLFNLGAIR